MNRPFAGRSMVLELAGREPFPLGHASIDPVSREARWEGGEERLQPQTLKVVIALAAKRGEVVTRDELVELCWDGRIVGDDVINRSVSLARHLATRAGGFSIQTVPRAGYRLVEDGHASRSTRRRRIAIAAVAALTIAAIASAILFTRGGTDANSPNLTVAIQQFDFDKGDEASRRLAVSVQDASTRMLSESGLLVEAVDSAQLRNRPPDFVLSGVIAGSAGKAVATVRLEDPSRHSIALVRQIQAQADDPDALPDQVGASLAAALAWAEPIKRLDRAHPSDPALVANLFNTTQSNFDSKREYAFALRYAPRFPSSAIAQIALAVSTGKVLFGLPIADRAPALATGQRAAARAMLLAPEFGDNQVQWCMLHSEAWIAECETRLRDGMATDPDARAAPTILGHLLLNVGRIDEAVSVDGFALADYPYGPGKMAELLNAFEAAGQTGEAEALYRRGHRLWPNYRGFFLDKLGGMLARGDFDALAAFERQLGSGGLPDGYPSLAQPLALALRERSLPMARQSCRRMADDDLPMIQCMLALSRLGDLGAAFDRANRLYPRRTGRTASQEEALWLADSDSMDAMYLTGAGAAALRTDPRYLQLAERVGLLRYWQQKALPDFCTRAHEPVCRKIAAR